MENQSKINYKDYLARDEQVRHSPYENELAYFDTIRKGDVTFLKNNPAQIITSDNEGFGVLSDNPIKNQLYHFIVGTTLATRFCVEGGMELDAAYSLSDYYIRKGDKATSVEAIRELYQAMVLDFATRMQQLNRQKVYAKPIVKSLDYIYNHLHEKISITDIAAYVHLNPSYLSKLFKKECGISVSEYISKQRLEAAENMLKYSDYTYSEIASTLMFASQSYFIKVFREHTGITPKEYRNKYYRKSFSED